MKIGRLSCDTAGFEAIAVLACLLSLAPMHHSMVTRTTCEADPSVMPLPVQNFADITDLKTERVLLELHIE